jgi:hypothetical protein
MIKLTEKSTVSYPQFNVLETLKTNCPTQHPKSEPAIDADLQEHLQGPVD